jgi:tRNA modification GTPase
MDLTQAEAVMDLISAQTDLALRAANDQLEGRLGRRIRAISGALVELLAHIEASIDFPDEDIVPETGDGLRAKLNAVRREMRALLETETQGRVLREGVRTVICGAPNVGKSSLLNLLLGYERAIVSARPGTTRDVIEEVVSLRGIPLRLIDTAGLRESEDEIEQEGMARTRRQLQRADLVLQVFDASQPSLPLEAGFFHDTPSFAEGRICGDASGCCTILVLNKIDLGQHETWSGRDGARISCLTGSGIPELEEAVITRITGGEASRRDWSSAINARHKVCLEKALKCAEVAQQTLENALSPEFVAEELRAALEAIGDVVGRVETEEVLTKIFSTFCIGK